MTMNRVCLFTLLVFLAVFPGCDSRELDRDEKDANYVHVKEDDAAMNAAIARAKATFPQFVAALKSPKPSYRGFGVKKPYATPSGGQEHMWIEDVKESNGAFEGTIANDAYDTLLVKNGQRVRFAADEISDWKYLDNNVLVGGFTIRYFVDRMSQKEKQELEKEAGFQIR